MQRIIPYREKTPKISPSAFVAPDSWVIGDCEIGDDATVLFGAVIRGDILPIRIGKGSNIQDQVMIHTQTGTIPTEIGERVTIGHRAVLHSCQIGNEVLVGMGAILLDGVIVEDHVVIGAGTVVPPKMRIPRGSMVMGVPGRVVRELSHEEIAYLKVSAERYVLVGQEYKKILGSAN